MLRVAVWGVPGEIETLDGFSETVRPVGEAPAVRLTVPLKPF
jgi:hypothetical protein